MKLETLAVHAGWSPDPITKSVAVPIYQTTSYAFDDTQHGQDLFELKVPGNIYTRMLEPYEAAHGVSQLLSRPADELNLGNFKLCVAGTAEEAQLFWARVNLDVRNESLAWSENAPLVCPKP